VWTFPRKLVPSKIASSNFSSDGGALPRRRRVARDAG
jgi:hypothetical protein